MKPGIMPAAVTCLLAAICSAQAPANFTDGQRVEAREGDKWSAATVLKKEGRRYQIRYDDGAEEWVMPERLRPGAASAAGPAKTAPSKTPAAEAKAPPAPAALPPADRPRVWKPGDTVEYKSGPLWLKARLVRIERTWHLIEDGHYEWVEPWRLRHVGDTDYELANCRPGPACKPGDDAPLGIPGPKPGPAPSAQPAGEARPRPAATPASEARPPAARPAPSGGRQLKLFGSEHKWQVTPDPSTSTSSSLKPVPLPRIAGRALSTLVQAGGAAAVAFNGRDQEPLTVQTAADGKLTGTWTLAPDLTLHDVSGKRIAARSHNRDRVEVWSTEDASARRLLTFYPYGEKEQTNSVLLLGEHRLLTTSYEGEAVVWEVAGGRPAYRTAVRPFSQAAVSPGGKYIALVNDTGLYILNAADGRIVGCVSGSIGRATTLSFNESGTWLVAGDGWTIWGVDLKTGELVREFMVPEQERQFSAIQAAGDGYALLDGAMLVDVRSRMPLAKYQTPDAGALSGGHDGRLWYVADVNSVLTLFAIDLPATQLKRARELQADEFLVLKPGTSISIVTSLGLSAEEQTKVRNRLEDACAANGFKVRPNSPLRLVATTEAGKPEQRRYGSWMHGPFGRGGETVTVTPHISRLRLEQAGATLWEVSAKADHAANALLTIKEGQSLQDAVNAATKASPDLFLKTPIPPYLSQLPTDDFVQHFRLNAGGPVKIETPPTPRKRKPDEPEVPEGALSA